MVADVEPLDVAAQTAVAPLGAAKCAALLLALCALLYLPGLWTLPLAEPEEARCAAIAQDMIRRGDWLVPHLNGMPYAEKPGPFFAIAAAASELTGNMELGGRLVAALAATMAVLVSFAFARRIGGNTMGLLSGAVLATSLGFAALARWYRMDMPLTASIWAALWCYARGQLPGASRYGRWIGFYALCGLAVLMKGPLGLLLPLGVVVLWELLKRRWSFWGELVSPPHLLGLAVFALVAVPWYVLAYLREPAMGEHFLGVTNIGRFETVIEGHTFPAFVYVLILLGATMPWVIYLPAAIIADLRRPRQPSVVPWACPIGGLNLFLWLGVLVPLAFFMSAETRLITYVLPCVPPLAMLLALTMARWALSSRPERLLRFGTASLAVAAILLLATLGVAEMLIPRWFDARDGATRARGQEVIEAMWNSSSSWLDWWFAVVAAPVAAAAIGILLAVRRNRRLVAVACSVAAVAALALYATLHVCPPAYARASARELGLEAKRLAGPEAVFCTFGDNVFSFGLYGGHPEARQYRYPSSPDELPPARELLELMNSSCTVFCLTEQGRDLQYIVRGCPRVREIARQSRWVLVTNLPPHG